MMNPIHADKAEALIQRYIELRYLVMRGEISKLYTSLEAKARELGMGVASAWRLVRWAKQIGMVDSCYYLV